MSVFSKEPVDWTIQDVADVVSLKLPESQRLEYKSGLSLRTNKEKSELAKDLSGFANADGGWILFGVQEDDSPDPVPCDITPISIAGIQTDAENAIDSVLNPVPEYSFASLPAGKGTVLVVRVKPHRARPVMVQGYQQFRYFRRSGTRTIPMSSEEVSNAHSIGANRVARLNAKVASLPLMARLTRSRFHDESSKGPPSRWVPLATVVLGAINSPEELFDLELMREDAFAEELSLYRQKEGHRTVRPGAKWSIGPFGLLEEEWGPVTGASEEIVLARSAIYRAGVIEWAHRYGFEIPTASLVDDVCNALLYGAGAFISSGYEGDLAIWIRIENADEATLRVSRDLGRASVAPESEWVGSQQERTARDLLADPMPVVRTAMDYIWQGFGYPRCHLFDLDGNLK